MDFDGSSRDLTRGRIQKSRAGWVALRHVLSRDLDPTVGHAAFLESAAFADGASASALDVVWADPSSYYRVRLATDLRRAVHGGHPLPPLAAAYAAERTDLARAFRDALASWRDLSLALAVLGGRDLAFDVPIEVQEPTPLIGLDVVIERPARVAGVRAGTPVSTEGRPIPLERCPRVRVDELDVRMMPFLFMVPGHVTGLPGLAFQTSQRPLAVQAYEWIRDLIPKTFRELSASCRVLAMKPYAASSFVNQTHSHFPGGAMLSAVPNAHELADRLVHEWAHDRLFALDEGGAFLAATDAAREAVHYSPWRDDRRPIQGLVHAVYVHIHVWPFWRPLVERDAAAEVAELARDRLARYALQLRLGLHQIHQFAPLTERGQALTAWMRTRVAEIVRATDALELGPDVPARIVTTEGRIVPERVAGEALTVGTAVARHAQRNDGAEALATLGTSMAERP